MAKYREPIDTSDIREVQNRVKDFLDTWESMHDRSNQIYGVGTKNGIAHLYTDDIRALMKALAITVPSDKALWNMIASYVPDEELHGHVYRLVEEVYRHVHLVRPLEVVAYRVTHTSGDVELVFAKDFAGIYRDTATEITPLYE